MNSSFKLGIGGLCVSLTLLGCGAGNGEGLDEFGRPASDGQANDNQDSNNQDNSDQGNSDQENTGDDNNNSGNSVSLATIQEEIFSPICSVCHAGSSAPRGLRLDSKQNSFDFLVGVDADEVPTTLRVSPGNPDGSYLVQKIEGAPGIVGGQMPLGGPALSDQQISLVRSWIEQGASATESNKSEFSSIQTEAVGIRKHSDTITFDFYISTTFDQYELAAWLSELELTVQSAEGELGVSPLVSDLSDSHFSIQYSPESNTAETLRFNVDSDKFNSMESWRYEYTF